LASFFPFTGDLPLTFDFLPYISIRKAGIFFLPGIIAFLLAPEGVVIALAEPDCLLGVLRNSLSQFLCQTR
jgi:hypothetical protein